MHGGCRSSRCLEQEPSEEVHELFAEYRAVMENSLADSRGESGWLSRLREVYQPRRTWLTCQVIPRSVAGSSEGPTVLEDG